MEQPIGFLDSELDRVPTGRRLTSDTENVIPIDGTLRQQAYARESGRPSHALLDCLPAAVYTTDAAGRITYYNEAAAEFWGQRPPLGTSKWSGSWKLYWPDGAPMAHEECPLAIALKEDRRVRMEAMAERPDGTCVPFIACPTPLHDEAGRLTGAVNMLVDITERKRAEEHQQLLVRELHHRVKNTLATVQAIMGSTARSAGTIEEFKDAMIGRIGSLARTHLLLSEEGASIDFSDILHNELEPFEDGSGERVRLAGPRVEIASRLAVSLGMAIHELTTNAAKYGALSVYGGRVDVTWRVTVEATRRTLEFDWVESGGPEVAPPSRQGFGSRLLDFVLPGQIQARSRIDYRPAGVHVRCTLPLPGDQTTAG